MSPSTAPAQRANRRPTRVGILRMCELPEVSYAVHGPYMRLFEMLFADRAVELLDIAVHEGDTPTTLADADVWIATGSPASVYDDLGWIATAEQIVRDAAAAEVPFVGICFGHQLVGQALGGRVDKAAVGWGVGALDYAVTASAPVPTAMPPVITVLASHQDQVIEAPDVASVWATSAYCPNAGLLVGDRMWTIQGHPEFTPDLVRALYVSRRERIGGDKVDAALATLDRPLSNAVIVDAILATPYPSPGA